MKRTTLLLILASLALASPATAAYDPLDGGTTKLTLSPEFLNLLKQNGVQLRAQAPVKIANRAVTFPITGGKFDPTKGRGIAEHEGTLLFEAGQKRLPLRSLQLKTTRRRGPFSAKVGGGQLKLATTAGLSIRRAGFGSKVQVSALKLSAKFAERLDKKLRLHGTFKAGQPVGIASTVTQPTTIALAKTEKVAFTLGPEIAAKLASLFVAVNPIFPAEHPGAVYTLPIFGGVIAPDGSAGRVETSGSLELLQLGGGQLFWQEAWLEPGGTAQPEVDAEPSPPYAGKVGRIPIADFSLIGATASQDRKARTVTIQNAALILHASTAQTMNELFAKPQGKENVFRGGELLGTVSFTAQGQ